MADIFLLGACLLGIVHMDRILLTLTDLLYDPHGHKYTYLLTNIYIIFVYIYTSTYLP